MEKSDVYVGKLGLLMYKEQYSENIEIFEVIKGVIGFPRIGGVDDILYWTC